MGNGTAFMSEKVTLILALVFGQALCAAAPSRFMHSPGHLYDPHLKDSCWNKIQDLIAPSLAGNKRVCIGQFGNMEWILESAGVPEMDAIGILGWLDLQKTLPQTNPVFSRAVREMDRQGSAANLFVCVMRKDCEFKSEGGALSTQALHLATEYIDQRDFTILRPPAVAARDRVAPSTLGPLGIRGGIRTVILKVPDTSGRSPRAAAIERRDFVGMLAHETAHAADHDLFSDWILANYTLIQLKRYDEVDKLFLQITRDKSPDGVLMVDRGFMITFMESRGYGVSEYVDQKHRATRMAPDRPVATSRNAYGSPFGGMFEDLFGDADSMQILPHADTCITVIREGGGGWFLDRNDIDARNIFDFGVRLGTRMEKTIKAAGIYR
jgi:hypothetical protein